MLRDRDSTQLSSTSLAFSLIISERHLGRKYETSLIDMLDAISPISAERQRPRCRETDNFSPAPRIHSRSSRLTLSQSPRGQPPTEDPEESKMLEEIFFIC
ncbi:hypothetical protein XELAEV_18008511mg [Xenopus laevis]|uniref:Uncharacterized protein n=1 Tax=Xenopus laevis TaxID=8355 RepID=A0A974E3T1_XENLA|nr:hypothetical protein XELAEV_18008511mg [Xenopus laevis]